MLVDLRMRNRMGAVFFVKKKLKHTLPIHHRPVPFVFEEQNFDAASSYDPAPNWNAEFENAEWLEHLPRLPYL